MIAYAPVSLGYSCQVKYQLSRELYRRLHPDGEEEDFRRMLMTPELGQRTFERHVFDWQITPFAALMAYLENDFRGVFEREDLVVDGSEVAHRTLRTRHPHDFRPVDGVLDDAVIDAQYPAARAKFEHLADKFHRHLRAPGDFLYVRNEIRIYDETVRLRERLSAGSPDHRFKILYVGLDGEDQWMEALDGEVFKAWTTAVPDKAPDRAWEGDDGRWTALLAGFPLRSTKGTVPRTFDESLAPSG